MDLVSAGRLMKLRSALASQVPSASSALSNPLSRLVDRLLEVRRSLADFHLAPMMAYFTAAPEGEEAVARHPKLSAWWEVMRRRSSFAETDPAGWAAMPD
jgi:glutathione S-transferase